MTTDKAREILGKRSDRYTDKELKVLIQLVELSLDTFEQKNFGDTLGTLVNKTIDNDN